MQSLILIKDGKAFSLATHGDFAVPEELPSVVITNKPAIRYAGPKIPLAEWKRVLAFFSAVYKATNSECQVRLYRNRTTGEWKAWAFPQTKRSGMTTNEVPGSSLWAKSQALFGDDWMHFGSVHHHCSSSAFQSSVDKADEVGNAVGGIHITVGFMDKPVHDIHARAVVSVVGELDGEGNVLRKARTETGEVLLSDWFDLGIDLTKIPSKYHADIAKDLLSTPASNSDSFPSEWLENLVEREYTFPNQGTPLVGNCNRNWWRDDEFAKLNRQQHAPVELPAIKLPVIDCEIGGDYGWDEWNKGGLS